MTLSFVEAAAIDSQIARGGKKLLRFPRKGVIMKKMVWGVMACLTLVALVGVSPALARGPERIVNIFEIDSLGNVASVGALTLNGRPLSIGEKLGAGLIQNTGSRPAVLALSNGSLMKLEAGEVGIVASPAPVQQCVCKCGTTWSSISETDKDKCAAHSGDATHPAEDCLTTDNQKKQLYGCSWTWVDPSPSPSPSPSPVDQPVGGSPDLNP
jgi:hypothetical protein